MDLDIVNRQRKYPPVQLIDPPPLGYIHVAAAVGPPAQPGPPVPRRSREKSALLTRLTSLAAELEKLAEVVRATVYSAVVVPPPGGYAKDHAAHVARYDVVVLIETTSPDVIGDVQGAKPYTLLLDAVAAATKDLHVMTARCVRRVGDVDKSRQGLFLFNYFVAEDERVALELWDHLAGWYAVATGMDNSTLLAPIGDADYVFVNHARWDSSLPLFMVRQFARPSFWTYVRTNLLVNRTGAMPILYRLA
ncbi:MAG: hypothetical protein ACRDPK_06785 [Carbonactinosporaceae bacterium]